LEEVVREEVIINIGSISELARYGELFPGTPMSLRFNPGIGDGENDHVITGGQKSKFGILKSDFVQAREIIQTHRLKLEGLHCHIGSGFYKTEQFQVAIDNILDQASQFPNIKFVDLGGGFGVRYDQKKQPIDLVSFGKAIEPKVKELEKKNGRAVEIRFEPGKYLVAESTCFASHHHYPKTNRC
jgi:diaminopimelate decarboxylase